VKIENVLSLKRLGRGVDSGDCKKDNWTASFGSGIGKFGVGPGDRAASGFLGRVSGVPLRREDEL